MVFRTSLRHADGGRSRAIGSQAAEDAGDPIKEHHLMCGKERLKA